MTILAFDTATALLSVALSVDRCSTQSLWYVEVDAGQRHSELLMDTADTLLKKAGLAPAELDAVACMKGPGSFTGLRIAFAAAKGLALALNIHLLTAPTLDCMAAPHRHWPGIVIPAIDAKRRCFFTALYRGADRLTEYLDADGAAITQMLNHVMFPNEPVLLTGPDAGMLAAMLSEVPTLRLDPACRSGHARELATLARTKLEANKGIVSTEQDELRAGPLYLRKSDAELNLS
ncbi:MAG: tRNA (adenosine(37)-N6)-threonylcarbamoyltransferase complex dimerization subunit type 1 TsaB [Treponema sp.]|jgi:tRNA threonylcarbamoyladenosine biosynthesis protein TsaB|nr:tRNA (adenosine(37)-N6)-threonylcarbamoyltransferase complex dimerization subunit type 1 TsaB [Treponema sp.]